jgi:hypothetical protein
VASFNASYPTIAAGAPVTFRPTRIVKNSLSRTPVSQAGTDLLPSESRSLSEEHIHFLKSHKNNQVASPPITNEIVKPVIHGFMRLSLQSQFVK